MARATERMTGLGPAPSLATAIHAQRHGPRHDRYWAYTLLEVVTVIGIVGVLAALLVPAILGARARARRGACVSNLAQVGHAVALYVQDYDGLYPWAVDPPDKYVPGAWSSNPAFAIQVPNMPLVHVALLPYTRSRDLFRCPDDTGYDTTDFSGYPLNGRPSSFDRFGTSFDYRTDLCVRHLGPASVAAPSDSPVLFDAAGNWHGGPELPSWRYSVLIADGRVANMTRDRLDRLFAFPP